MLKIYNATRRWQEAPILDDWRRLGVEIVPTGGPGVSSVPPHADGEWLAREAKNAVDCAVKAGADGVLVSGITGLAVLIAVEAVANKLRVIEPVTRKVAEGQRLERYREFTDQVSVILDAFAALMLDKASKVKVVRS